MNLAYRYQNFLMSFMQISYCSDISILYFLHIDASILQKYRYLDIFLIKHNLTTVVKIISTPNRSRIDISITLRLFSYFLTYNNFLIKFNDDATFSVIHFIMTFFMKMGLNARNAYHA